MAIKHYFASRGTRRRIYVMNSRLAMYEVTYGDGLWDIVPRLISRIAPKVIPVTKEIGMRAFNVIKERAGEQLGSSGFKFIKDKL